jgi:hypothetical protein
MGFAGGSMQGSAVRGGKERMTREIREGRVERKGGGIIDSPACRE